MNKKLLMIPICVGLFTPSFVIFCLQVFVGRYTVLQSLNDIVGKQFAHGHNLFLLALTGLIPFVLLSFIMIVYDLKKKSSNSISILISGLIGILALMIPAHVSVWYPLYGPGTIYSTSVIAFLFIPFYCIATMLIGLILGALFLKMTNKFKKRT